MAGPQNADADDRADAPGSFPPGPSFGAPPSLGPAPTPAGPLWGGPGPGPSSFVPGAPPPPVDATPPPPPGVTPPPPSALAPNPYVTAAPDGGDFFSGYGGVAAPPPPPPRRRRTAGAVAAGAALVLAATLGFVVLGGGPDAQAAVLNAVNSTLADKTAHLTLDMTVTADGTSITASGTGSVDFGQDALALDASMAIEGHQLSLNEVMLGGTLYESVPGIGLIEPGKSWVSADLSQFTQSTTSGTEGALGASDNPVATLHMLAQQGNTVTSLGPSTVDGTAVQGYAVTIDKNAIEKQVSGTSLPAWVRHSLSGLDFSGIDVQVYIDGQGQLRREVAGVTMTVASHTLSANVTVDFSDYGTPVDVTAPPPDQVVSLEQFLHDAAADEGGSSGS